MTNIIAIALAACLAVETSNGRNIRRSDGGNAVGILQTWPCAVAEANRIEKILSWKQGRKPRRWTLQDRQSVGKSKQMCAVTLEWHYRRGTRCPVELACKWRNPYSKCPEWHKRKIETAVKEIKQP